MNKCIDTRAVPASHFDVIRELGRGGSSIVYLVKHRETGERYAMKSVKTAGGSVPHPGAPTPEHNAGGPAPHLAAEARTLECLGKNSAGDTGGGGDGRGEHPGIPAYFGEVCDENGGFAGFLMEYVEGDSLQEKLDAGRIFTVREAAEAGLALCGILEQLHKRDPPLIYRDLKPANILTGEDGRIVLVDYGAVRAYKAGAGRDTHRLGTEGYAAPEQYGGWEQSDARTDIYGIGAVLHHMLTGLSPIETGLGPLEEFVPCRRRQYAEMGKILRRCCHASQSMRFSSCRELEKALRGVCRICEREKMQGSEPIWRRFVLLASASLVFLICSGMLWASADGAAEAGYRQLIREAQGTEGLQEKKEAYCRAIPARPKDPAAFLSFLGEIAEDFVITEEERAALEDASFRDGALEKMRRASPSDYAGLELQIGKALFSCYSGGTDAARRAFRNAAAAAGPHRGMGQTAEAMCVICRDGWSAEKAEALRQMEKRAAAEAMEDGDGLFAAAVCRTAAGDLAFSAGLYREAGIGEAQMEEVIETAVYFLEHAERGWPHVPAGLIQELRTAVESAERSMKDENH